MILLLLILAFIAALVVYLIKYYYPLWREMRLVPGPRSYPLIGNIEIFRNRYDIFGLLRRYSAKYQGLFKIWFGPIPMVVLTDVELVKRVLNSPQMLRKPSIVYGLLRLPNGLVGSDYKIWRNHRKIINPTFNSKILRSFVPIFIDQSKKIVSRMLERDLNEEFDLYDEILFGTTTTVFETTMGSDVFNNTEFSNPVKLFKRICNMVEMRLFDPILRWDFTFKFTKIYQEDKVARQKIMNIIDRVIETRKELKYLSKNKSVSDQKFFTPQIFIDQLLTSSLTDLEIRDESYTMLAGGSDTTAATVAYACLFLAMHPQAQATVIEEVDEYFERHCGQIDMENLNQLTYLDMVVKETLRLAPVVPFIYREAIEDFDLGPFVAKPGMVVMLDLFTLQRRKDYWGENADQYWPERFAPENAANINLNAFLPFSIGMRNCVGYRYGMLSVKIMMVHLLKNIKFTTSLNMNELQFVFQLFLKLKNQHMVKLIRR